MLYMEISELGTRLFNLVNICFMFEVAAGSIKGTVNKTSDCLGVVISCTDLAVNLHLVVSSHSLC